MVPILSLSVDVGYFRITLGVYTNYTRVDIGVGYSKLFGAMRDC